MNDLFSAYPDTPGYKRSGTSQDAAEAIKDRAPSLQAQVLELLKDAALTADECATLLGKKEFSIRPRLSQAKAKGLIFDTGKTRKNTSGADAIVWKACPTPERPPPQAA
jgi:predicted HTH transcriptional regulator